MSALTQSRNTWHKAFFTDPVTAALRESLPDRLKAQAAEFIASGVTVPDKREAMSLDRWYSSEEGTSVLIEALTLLWDTMSQRGESAMPAHDVRHAMLKVPAAALEYMSSEEVQGWERVGLLGAVLHDYGRWAEERVYGGPGTSVLHARMSFVLGRELLERLPLPFHVRRHILLAALKHSSGAVPEDPMPLKMVVSADRDQLFGPEIILRLVHHAPEASGALASLHSDLTGRSVLSKLENFLRTRLPGPLFSRQAHVDQLWNVLCTFIMLCESGSESRRRFAVDLDHEGDYAGAKRPVPARDGRAFNWAFEHDFAHFEAAGVLPGSECFEKALADFLSAVAVAPGQQHKEAVTLKAAGLSEVGRSRWARALTFATEMRQNEDLRQLYSLRRLRQAERKDPVVQALLDRLIPMLEQTEDLAR